MKSRAGVLFPFPDSGELDRRVVIRRRRDVAIGSFSVESEHSDERPRWASLKPVGTAVWNASLQTDEVITHRCIIRFTKGITTDHEVLSRGVVYRVKRGADLQGAERFLVLDLEELGAEEALYGAG